MTRPRTTPVEDWDTVLTGGPTPPRSSFGDGILLRPQTTPTRPACAEFDSRVAHKDQSSPGVELGALRAGGAGLGAAINVSRMLQPVTSRPYMPGYGTQPSDQGTGLLPWSWAVEQLRTSRNYWLATAGADGQPHAMPVWGVWLGEALWFACGLRARKMRNLSAQPRCSLSTQDPEEPVMLQGVAEVITGRERIAEFLAASNAKYAANVEMDFLDPAVNATVRVVPRTVIGLKESDFQGSPTRWRFPG